MSTIIRRDHPGAPDVLRELPDASASIARGLVVIDKPAGCTSHDVVDRVRRALKIRRVGHSGTLDPEVTGVLPVGLGQATRVLSLLLGAGKTYDTVLRLHGDEPAERVRDVLAAQVGTITQKPPVRSRVKRVERERDIYALDITGIERRDVRFVVRCEAGTYIRKLCHDVGEELGCGGHMHWLRRTRAGGFGLDDCVTLEQLEAAATAARDGDDGALTAVLMPLERAIPADMPRIWLDPGAIGPIANGAALGLPGVLGVSDTLTPGQPAALMAAEGWLVALADADLDAQAVRERDRGIIARPRRVFWPPAGV